jgi:hypothetical protein
MAPFMKEMSASNMKINWQRIVELIIIVALNAAVLITTLQLKISYLDQTIKRLEGVIYHNDGRLDEVESKVAVCMDRTKKP